MKTKLAKRKVRSLDAERGKRGPSVAEAVLASKSKNENESTCTNDDQDQSSSLSLRKYKSTVANLQKTDPDFFAFLQQEDAELLKDIDEEEEEENVDEVEEAEGEEEGKEASSSSDGSRSDDDEEEEDGIEVDQGEQDEEKGKGEEEDEEEDLMEQRDGITKTTRAETEQVGAVDEEYFDSVAAAGPVRLSKATVRQWEQNLDNGDKKLAAAAVSSLVEAFGVAVAGHAAADERTTVPFTVDDSRVFACLLRLCLKRLGDSLRQLLGDEAKPGKSNKFDKSRSKPSSKFPHWSSYSGVARRYLTDLAKFLPEVQSSEFLFAALQQVYNLLEVYVHFPKLAKLLIKTLSKIWATKGILKCRLMAFVAIVKLVRSREKLFSFALKNLYINYVRHTKVVTDETWPFVQFMQSSFCELCRENLAEVYKFAFIYIRQLAIHLRNATISKKKELITAVYNWQYIQCCYLWAAVLAGLTKPSESGCETEGMVNNLAELVHPLAQVISGCARLVPSPKYYPLRFHCVRALLILASVADCDIPLLHLLDEVIEKVVQLTASKRTKVTSSSLSRRQSLAFQLKTSRSRQTEIGYKDALVNGLYELLLLTFRWLSSSLAFPEATAYAVHQLKKVVKSWPVARFSRQFRGLIDKVEQQSEFVKKQRKLAAVDLRDRDSVNSLEIRLRQSDENPLEKFYQAWRAVRENDGISSPLETVEEKFRTKRRKLAGPVKEERLSDEEETQNVPKRRKLLVKEEVKIENGERKSLDTVELTASRWPQDDTVDVVQELVLSDND